MKHQSTSWDTLLVVAMMLLAGVCAQAQAAVQNAEAEALDSAQEIPPVEEPTYWIGIRGRSIESAVLRTHLQLAEDMGVVVEEILDDSPAAKAGLRKHDIILRVNGDAVDNMQVLQSQVRASKEKSLELKIIRLGKQEKISLVPEVLPEALAEKQRQADRSTNRLRGRFNGRRLEGDAMQLLLEQLGARNLGPGIAFRGGQMFKLNQLPDGQLPNGVSVSIQRNSDRPAQITVKQGEKTWQIEAGDEKALDQLPDELRPQVERMLNNPQGLGGAHFDFNNINKELEELLPRGLGGFGSARQPNRLGDPMLERMEQLERRLEALNKRLNLKPEWKPLPSEVEGFDGIDGIIEQLDSDNSEQPEANPARE